jgi:mannose-6-phosphate isomerase-like protein (cupin superfamily)
MDTSEHGEGRLSLAVETLAPGQQTTPHWHMHLEEVYFILHGQGDMTVGEETRTVRAGDAILIPTHRVHSLRNTGSSELALLCPVSPPWNPQDYHTEGEVNG